MIYLERVSEQAIVPTKGTAQAACYDLCADIDKRAVAVYQDAFHTKHGIVIKPGGRVLIPTGWKMRCEPGFRIAMYPRSGLSVKNGVSLVNCVGVIDSDYCGEVMIPLVNHGDKHFEINHGDRVAQIALERLEEYEFVEVDELPEVYSDRVGGLGSTGVK